MTLFTQQEIDDKEEYLEQKKDIQFIVKNVVSDIQNLIKELNDISFYRNLNQFNPEQKENIIAVEEKAKELLVIIEKNKNVF